MVKALHKEYQQPGREDTRTTEGAILKMDLKEVSGNLMWMTCWTSPATDVLKKASQKKMSNFCLGER